jgi:hypothetical protein
VPASRKKPMAADATTTRATHPPDRFKSDEHEVTSVAAVVDSRAQEAVAGPVPAEVVSDRRDTPARRMSKLAFIVAAIVLLGFIANGIINTEQRLHRAEHERSVLIQDITRLVHAVQRQDVDLRALRQAIIRQNKILRRAGLPTVPVPTLTSEGGGAPRGGGQSSTPRSQPPSSAPPSSRPTSHPSSHSPSPHPSPSSSPVARVCLPVVGCIPRVALAHMTVLDWEAILVRLVVEDT